MGEDSELPYSACIRRETEDLPVSPTQDPASNALAGVSQKSSFAKAIG